MTHAERLLENYAAVQDKLAAACVHCGRKREDVLLVAVSKFHPAEDIAIVASAGQKDFGENYVQEALAKQEALAQIPDLRWHMIGHVQSRKAAQVADRFALLHTVDKTKLADGLQKRLEALDKKARVLLEVNIGDEPQKSGVAIGDLSRLASHVAEHCPRLRLAGLMCLPPVFDDGEASRPYFAKLRQLRDNLSAELGMPLPELSMGMSGDFPEAVAEGATIVRIGTDIFGPRPPRAPD